MHFNLWNSKANDIDFLDVGVMCPLEDQSYTVDLSFPGDYGETPKIECINYLIQDTAIARNIFNCGMEFHDTSNSKYARKDNDVILISNYKTDQQQDPYSIPLKNGTSARETRKLTKEYSEDSSRITIHILVSPKSDCPDVSDTSGSDESQSLVKKEYFRFRIYNFDLKPFSTKASSKTNFLVRSVKQTLLLTLELMTPC